MTTMIMAALALSLFQFWLLPASLNLSNLPYLLSSRDQALDKTIMQGRIERANNNLKESLPAFLVLCLLAIIQSLDLTQFAIIWLALRIAYIPCYMFNIIYVRTLVWLASLACLVCMATQLI